MVTALTWDSYLDTMSRLAVVEPDNVDFLALAPQMVNYAELRMCRDLDFLSNIVRTNDFTLTVGVRTAVVPLDEFVVIDSVEVITPSGIVGTPDLGTRHALWRSTREFITNVYPSQASAGLPKYFALTGQGTITVGPYPDQPYALTIFGTGRPDSLSATVPATFISTFLPDLFIMASMVWISGYQRNFGRQSDDPQQAMSYEAQYMTLLKSAMVEEARKKAQSSGWSPYPPPVVASPSRNATGAPG